MKKRIFVSLLAALMILSALTFVSCNSGKGGSSGGNTSSSVKTEKLDMSVEDAVKKVEEAGCKAVVATVYSEDYDDGAVIGIDGFVDGAEKDSYITVAVNDLSIKKQIEDQYLLPLVIEQSRYENEIYNKIKEDKSSESMFSAYYSLLDPSSASDKELASMNNTYPITKNGTAVYVFDTSSSEKEYKMIESIIKEKTSYSYEEMFKDYVSLGIIPTITENTKAHMITADQLKVEDNETGVTVTSYTGNGGVVILPDDVDGKAITEITKGAFPQIDMHSIVLGENMRSVGSSSFPNAYGLFDIKTPAALMNIDANAFSGILFTNTDDNGFKTISGNILLAYTGPEATVAIPDAIEHIGGRAFFQNKAITAVEFPESIISIGTEAFRECSNLGNFTIPGNCIRIGDGAFYKCDPITEINIPDSVIEVGNEAFFECNYAAKITLGSGLKKIGANAFYYNGIKPLEDQSAPHLTEIDIPANVEYIGSEAFYKCLNLSTVNGMEGVTYVGGFAFNESNFYNGLHDQYSILAGALIKYTGTGEAVVPDGVKMISGAFSDAKVTKVTIPEGCEIITRLSFTGCTNLTDIFIPASVTTIEDEAFSSGVEFTIHGKAGSYAEEYANEKHIAFAAE